MVDVVRGAMAFHGKYMLEVDKQNFQKPSEIKFTNQQNPWDPCMVYVGYIYHKFMPHGSKCPVHGSYGKGGAL